MNWAKSLAGAVVALGLTTLALSHAEAQQQRTLRIATLQGAAQPAYKGLVRMSELVAQKTGNSLRIQYFGDGQLGTEQEMIEGVQLGTIDMYMGSSGAVGRFLPRLEAFAHPYVFRDSAHLLAVARGAIGEELDAELRQRAGIRILDLGWLFGERHLTTKNTEVRRPADMARLKIRVQPSGIYLDTIRAMGGNPTPMDFKEVYTSMQTGVIDGQENPLNVIAARAFYEVQSYLMLTSHITQNQAVIVSERVFQSLSPAHRAALLEATREAGDFQNKVLADDEKAQLELVRSKGMKVVQPDIAAFRAATADIHKKFEAQWGRGFFERIRDAK
ncbi:MAG: TRAP transporter substrate-binding protein [Tagaea sp.]|nr:TRAP transporter substrate-binding protein [Tagaea sp.]